MYVFVDGFKDIALITNYPFPFFYQDKQLLADIALEGMTSLFRQFWDPTARVTPTERARVVALLFKQVQKDNDLSGMLFEKFDAHCKLMRHEQRAFNQLRKKSLVKK